MNKSLSFIHLIEVYENTSFYLMHFLVCLHRMKKYITSRALSLRNGQDKPEIWVAYKGVVYDVTNSRLWTAGKHYEHWAGQDLTDELPDAPQSETVFERFPVIGKLLD